MHSKASQGGDLCRPHHSLGRDRARTRCAAQASGFGFLDAPCPEGRRRREWAADGHGRGEKSVFDAAQPAIMSFAKAARLLGPSGQVNWPNDEPDLHRGVVQGLAEAIHFGKKAGMDIEAVIDVISKGAAQSWQMENRYKSMIAVSSISDSRSIGCARTFRSFWRKPAPTDRGCH